MRASRCNRSIRSDHVSATRRPVVLLLPPPLVPLVPLVPPVYRVSRVPCAETPTRVAIFTPVLFTETSCSVARRALHRLAAFGAPYGRAPLREDSVVVVIVVVLPSMRRSFPAVPPSSSSSPSPPPPSSDVQCPRRLSSPPIVVAERHACHGAPRDASSASNLGSCKHSRSSVVVCSNLHARSCGAPETHVRLAAARTFLLCLVPDLVQNVSQPSSFSASLSFARSILLSA